jgi:hypothetical protein
MLRERQKKIPGMVSRTIKFHTATLPNLQELMARAVREAVVLVEQK